MKIAFDVDTYILKSHVEEKLLPRFKVAASPGDVAKIGHLLEPLELAREKYICCLCCRSGPIQLVCQLSKQAFEPGENIVFNLELHNQTSDHELGKVEVRLVQDVVLFHAPPSLLSLKKEDHQTVASMVLADYIEPQGNELWQNSQLMVPKEVVPTFENCDCIHVTYTFLVKVEVPGGLDMELKSPVSIINAVKCSQPAAGIPPVDQVVYPPPPVTMQPGTDIPSQPPPPYPGS